MSDCPLCHGSLVTKWFPVGGGPIALDACPICEDEVDDDDDFDEDACPKCERSNCSWEAGICVCHHCGYIGP